MRRIDWEGPLSDEDVAWLRQAGFMSEARIAAHQAQFGEELAPGKGPEDTLTRDALDAEARVRSQVEGTGNGSPVLVTPDPIEDEGEEDDYESWKVPELEDEVDNRNQLEGTGDVEVVGTGKDGKVLKVDLIKGLRLWDQENPGALRED